MAPKVAGKGKKKKKTKEELEEERRQAEEAARLAEEGQSGRCAMSAAPCVIDGKPVTRHRSARETSLPSGLEGAAPWPVSSVSSANGCHRTLLEATHSRHDSWSPGRPTKHPEL